MRDGGGVLIGMVGGALLGAVAGYLYLTEDGRRLRARLEPHLEELAVHLLRFRDSALRAGQDAQEAWETVAAAGERGPVR